MTRWGRGEILMSSELRRMIVSWLFLLASSHTGKASAKSFGWKPYLVTKYCSLCWDLNRAAWTTHSPGKGPNVKTKRRHSYANGQPRGRGLLRSLDSKNPSFSKTEIFFRGSKHQNAEEEKGVRTDLGKSWFVKLVVLYLSNKMQICGYRRHFTFCYQCLWKRGQREAHLSDSKSSWKNISKS